MDNKKWLKEKLMKKQALNKRKKIQNKKKMEKQKKQIAEFQELLLILIYLMGKQLVQSPKILSIRHSSLEKRKKKNVFIENGVVATVTQYSKDTC